MADIPPIMVQLGGSATGFLRMITNAVDRLTALSDAAKAAAEACSAAFDALDASASSMGDVVREAATSAGESLAALGEDARAVGAGFAQASEEMAASMQAAAADMAAAAAEMRAAVTEMAETVKVDAAEAGEATEGLGAKFLGLGEIGKMVKGLLPLSLAAVGYESIKMASTFQASMTQINTQAGVSKDKIAGLASGVLDLAGKVGFSPDSLSEALFHVESSFASTGITGQKALDILKVAAEGAAVGHANLVDVQNALDASIASGIPGVQNYSQAMGALNAIVGAGDMQMQDLANALGTGVLAVVKGYGLTLNDVGAALATFGDNSIRGSVAATDLRMAVESLAVPAKDGVATLQKWGLSADSLSKDMQQHGLVWTLNQLHDEFVKNGVTAKEQGAVITDMFGKKAGSGLAVLMGQLDRLNSKVPDIAKGAGGFAAAWQTATHTLSQQFADIKAGFDSVMIRIGTFLIPQVSNFISLLENRGAPVVHGFASALSGIASGFTGNTGHASTGGVQTTAGGQQHGGMASQVPALTGWQKLGQTLKGIAGDFETFGRDAAQAFRNLEQAAKPVAQVFGAGLVGALVVVGSLLAHVVGPALKGFTDLLAHNQGLIQFFATVVLGALITKMTVLGTLRAATGITDLATKILNFPTSSISSIGTAFTKLKESWSSLSTAAGPLISGLRTVGGNIASTVSGWGSSIATSVKNVMPTKLDMQLLLQSAKDAGSQIATTISGWGSNIASAASSAWSGIQSGASAAASAASSAWSGFVGMAGKVGTAAKEAAVGMLDLSRAALEGAVNAARSAAAWVAEKVALVATTVAEKAAAAAEWLLNFALDANPIMIVILAVVAMIAIFVLLYEKVGWVRDAVNGAFHLIGDAVAWVVSFVKSHWPLLLAIITGPIGVAVYMITHYWTQIEEGFAAAWRFIVTSGEKAASWLAALPGRILGWFAHAGSWLLNAGQNIIIGLWNGIVSMGSWIASQITGFIKSVVPGPVLKVLGIFSPSRVFHEIGVNVTKGLVNGITSGGQQVTSASTGLAQSAIRGFGSPGVALGVTGGRQLAMASGGYGASSAGAAAGPGVVINVAGTVVAERQLRDLVEKLNLQRGSRNSQTYQAYKK